MAEIVNLRRARKSQRRRQSEKQAETARNLSGESKSARLARALTAKHLTRHVDSHQLQPPAAAPTKSKDER